MNEETTFGGKSAAFATDLVNSIRENPASAALIGMGLLWLFSGGKSLDQINGLARHTGINRLPDRAADAVAVGQTVVKSGVMAAVDGVSNVGSGIVDKVSSAGASLRDGSNATVQRASEAASSLMDSAGRMVQSLPGKNDNFVATARSNLADLFQRQPLMLGAIGLAIGAGMAASIATTAAEADLLGERSDALKQKAREFARQQTKHAGDVAAGVADAVAEETRIQGLTANGLKAAVDDAGHKFKNIVGATAESVRERLN
jgi:hypothetical protein